MTTTADQSYTVQIQAAVPNTPITIADKETLENRRVVGYRAADWQAITPPETVTDPGTAAELARNILYQQDVAELTGQGLVRVRVWDGADADTGTEPTAVAYDEE
jgi:hypothetical protein